MTIDAAGQTHEAAETTGEVTLVVIATGEVQHHAPCVPECPVCYPGGPETYPSVAEQDSIR